MPSWGLPRLITDPGYTRISAADLQFWFFVVSQTASVENMNNNSTAELTCRAVMQAHGEDYGW